MKPKEVTTDLSKIKESIQNIYADGLSWGESKIEEVAYGIKKLVIGAIVKDRVSVEDLIEKIKKVDGVQDVDVASFNEVWKRRNWLMNCLFCWIHVMLSYTKWSLWFYQLNYFL